MTRWLPALLVVLGALFVVAAPWREASRPNQAEVSPAAPEAPAPPSASDRASAGAPDRRVPSRPTELPPVSAAPPASEPPSQEPVSLEKLLTLRPRQDELDPFVRRLQTPAEEERAERDGTRLRLEHRKDRAEHGSERRLLDELGLSVPLGEEDSLRLRGGIRLERQHSGSAEEREAGPALGLEKRF